MSRVKYFVGILIISAYVYSDDMNNKLDDDNIEVKTKKIETNEDVEKVDVKVFYESLCPYCINFFVHHLKPVTFSLHKYLNIQLYPYGNAETKEVDGHYETRCQHGEDECYGNKLNACAIDILKNVTKSTLYNCCLMRKRSNDAAATKCGASMKIDADPIKECAKSDKGNQLLKFYGDESAKANFHGVPHIVVNGNECDADDFKQEICDALKNPPTECEQ